MQASKYNENKTRSWREDDSATNNIKIKLLAQTKIPKITAYYTHLNT